MIDDLSFSPQKVKTTNGIMRERYLQFTSAQVFSSSLISAAHSKNKIYCTCWLSFATRARTGL